jgi:hypothetical protein
MGIFRAPVEDHLILPAQVRLPPDDERANRMLGRSIPAAVAVRLLIDTGAKRSSLIPGVMNHLGPTVAGKANVETSFMIKQTDLLWVHLEFPESSLAPVPMLAVARLPLPPALHHLHGIIGRDLLGRWKSFEYEGQRGRYTIHDSSGGLFGWLRY